MLLVGQQEGQPACKIWVVGCCLERGADLHMAQLLPLSLTVSCFSKTQIGFTFLVPAYPGSPGQRAIKQMCVYTAVDYERLDAVIRCLGLRVYCHFMFAWRRRVAVSVCVQKGQQEVCQLVQEDDVVACWRQAEDDQTSSHIVTDTSLDCVANKTCQRSSLLATVTTVDASWLDTPTVVCYLVDRNALTPSLQMSCCTTCSYSYCLQCFDTVGWASGRASGL